MRSRRASLRTTAPFIIVEEKDTHHFGASEKESITSEVGSLELLGCRNSTDKDVVLRHAHTCAKVEISNGINQSRRGETEHFKRRAIIYQTCSFREHNVMQMNAACVFSEVSLSHVGTHAAARTPALTSPSVGGPGKDQAKVLLPRQARSATMHMYANQSDLVLISSTYITLEINDPSQGGGGGSDQYGIR